MQAAGLSRCLLPIDYKWCCLPVRSHILTIADDQMLSRKQQPTFNRHSLVAAASLCLPVCPSARCRCQPLQWRPNDAAARPTLLLRPPPPLQLLPGRWRRRLAAVRLLLKLAAAAALRSLLPPPTRPPRTAAKTVASDAPSTNRYNGSFRNSASGPRSLHARPAWMKSAPRAHHQSGRPACQRKTPAGKRTKRPMLSCRWCPLVCLSACLD